MTAPNCILLASVWMWNSLLKSGYARRVSRAMIRFMVWNASSSLSVHMDLTLDDVSAVSGASVSDRLVHMYR